MSITSPNILDSIGEPTALIFTEYADDNLLSDLETRLGLSFGNTHKDDINNALNSYIASTKIKRPLRKETYKKFKILKDGIEKTLEFFSSFGDENGEMNSISQRLITEYSEIKSQLLTHKDIEKDFEKHGVTEGNNEISSLPIFYDHGIRNEFLREIIIYKHAIDGAIHEFMQEKENNKGGGNHKNASKDALTEQLKFIFLEASPKRKHGLNKNFELFYSEICKTLPEKKRPSIGKVGSLTKRVKRKKIP